MNEEYERLLPKLPQEEYEALKKSIKEEGLHYPIIVNSDGVILDGHHRFKACNELGDTPRCEVKSFENPLSEKKFVIESNLRRRHLNKFERAELSYPLLEIERELAKQRQIEHGKTQEPLTSNEVKGMATRIIAQKIGLSGATFERAITIIEKGSEKLKDSVRKGHTSITYAYKMIKRKEQSHELKPLPDGVFDVIYADPPWEYYLSLRGSPDMHYPTLNIEELKKIKVPSNENAVLFLWATNPKLEEALELIKAWGFTYKTNLVWVKDKFGTGYYFRGQHELLLLAVKGTMSLPLEENRMSSVLIVDVKEHSKKPEEARKIIEKMYPQGKYLELFARKKTENWESWGSELGSAD